MANKFAGKLAANHSAQTGFSSLIRGKKDVVEARWIETDKIYSVEQVRKNFDEAQIEGLAATLKGKKQHQPIIVYPIDESGKHRIDMGERRWRAAKLNGEPVLAIIDESLDQGSLDPKVRIARQIVENVARENLDAFELGQGLLELKNEGVKTNEIAAILGKKPAWVSKHLKLAKMPAMVQELYDLNIVTYIETLNILSDAARVDEDRTREFIAEIIEREQSIGRSQAQEFCDLLTGKLKGEPLKSEGSPQEASQQETSQQETSQQEASQQETSQQETSQQEASQQETSQQETSQQETSQQETSQQEASQQETSHHEASQQETSQQETSQHEASQQEISQQETSQQEASQETTQQQPDKAQAFNVFDQEPSSQPKILVMIDGEEWELVLKKSFVQDGEQYVTCQKEDFSAAFPAKDCVISTIF